MSTRQDPRSNGRRSRLFGLLLVVIALALLLLLRRESGAASLQIAKGPWVQRVSLDSAIVRVEVVPPTGVTLELTGPSSARDAGLGVGQVRVFTDQEAVTLHTINLRDLVPSTRYTYVVKAGALSKMGAFVTAPPNDSDAPFRFLVYGDNRTDDAAHSAVVRAMVPVASDFLIHTGDFVEVGGSAREWQNFFDIEAPLLSSRCLYSAVGNHELTDGAGIEYARFFGPTDVLFSPPTKGKTLPTVTKPEHLNGTFRWGNTRFFLLNGIMSFKTAATDRVWLDKALADSDAESGVRWRVVVVHHGPWSSGPHGMSSRLQEAGIVQVFKEHKVDLVLSGHDHIYERGWGDGLPFIVSGGGGAPVYKIKKRSRESRKAESVRHFVEVDVSAASLQIVATRSDGSTIERCALTKGAAFWDCDGPAGGTSGTPTPGSTSTTTSSSSSSGGSAGGRTPTSRCSCEVIGDPGNHGGSGRGLFAAGAAVMTLFFLARRRRQSIL